ncbi:hypothetical protein ABIE69_001386 [Rhodobacteraceae bacterium MBR-64]|jgi:hypothetical protein
MPQLSYIHSPDQTAPASDNGTRRDIRLINAALADAGQRQIAETLLATAARLIGHARAGRAVARPLDQAALSALGRLGVDGAEVMEDAAFYGSDSVAGGVAARVQVVGDAVPLARVARLIGVSDSRLRQRIGAGTLIAVARPHGRGWLIPSFQLTETGEVPHLARVLSALQRTLSAEALARAFTLPNDDLGGQSPRDWLISGGDPAPVQRLMAAL